MLRSKAAHHNQCARIYSNPWQIQLSDPHSLFPQSSSLSQPYHTIQLLLGHLASWQLAQLALSATAGARSANLRAVAGALVDALVLLAHLLGGSTAAADVCRVAVVAVDTDEIASHTIGLDVLNDDTARAAVVGAVAAAAVELAGVDDGVVLDGDSATAVVLDDLVFGLCGATALNEDVTVAQCGDGVLADIAEPDIGQSACTLAVDALKCVLANDDVGELGAVIEDEDGAVAAGVVVAVARSATIELAVATVEGATDGGWLGKRNDATHTGWDLEGLRCAEACQSAERKSGGELHLESN